MYRVAELVMYGRISKLCYKLNLGKYEQAIEYYDNALEIDPKYALALSNKGATLDKLGKYKEAIECYDKALEIDPKYALALSNKGWALHNLGKYEQAIEYYDNALEIDRNFDQALYNKSATLAYIRLRLKGEKKSGWKKFLKRD